MDWITMLQWAIPSGGVGAAIAWLANRNARQADNAKHVHDAYKTMYEDVSRLARELQEQYEETKRKLDELMSEHQRTRRALNRLSRAIEAIQTCPHSAVCPVSSELRLTQADDESNNTAPADDKTRGRRNTKGTRRVPTERHNRDATDTHCS